MTFGKQWSNGSITIGIGSKAMHASRTSSLKAWDIISKPSNLVARQLHAKNYLSCTEPFLFSSVLLWVRITALAPDTFAATCLSFRSAGIVAITNQLFGIAC